MSQDSALPPLRELFNTTAQEARRIHGPPATRDFSPDLPEGDDILRVSLWYTAMQLALQHDCHFADIREGVVAATSFRAALRVDNLHTMEIIELVMDMCDYNRGDDPPSDRLRAFLDGRPLPTAAAVGPADASAVEHDGNDDDSLVEYSSSEADAFVGDDEASEEAGGDEGKKVGEESGKEAVE